ncbi:MAG: acetyl-CoA carboxylase biotin carboxyl carrier protein [Acidithiobacillus sp.]
MDIQFIRRLAELLQKTDLDEIEVVEGESKVRITRHQPVTQHFQPAASVQTVAAVPTVSAGNPPSTPVLASVPDLPEGYMIKSPMVGTFYRASSPDTAPFVEEGSIVKAGQALCIIEAMKLLNEIEADVGGKVLKILAANGQPVEYGEPLFILAPER